MKLLSALFAKNTTVTVTRDDLATIVAPLMPRPEARDSAAIAHAWEETAEWLRIGFDAESDKGTLYHALHYALRSIAGEIRKAPDSQQDFTIDRSHLEILKVASPQLQQASLYLDWMSKQKSEYVTRYVEDRRGNRLPVPFTQIYNRPDAPHYLMGMKLEEIEANLDRFLDARRIRPASSHQIDTHAPRFDFMR